MRDKIVIHGAREHNLKNIDLELPRNKLIVITGLSGSGKSSLAFDTIYAEGQRKYVESISTYARQFLGQLSKPDVEHIEGLSPAISIQQRTASSNPRSTVATTTEIYDYLRLLFANIGTPHCPKCGKEISSQSMQEIIDQMLAMPEGTKLQVLAPVARGQGGEHQGLFDNLKKEGYVRVRIDGDIFDLSEGIKLRKSVKHNIEVVVDRLVVKEGIAARLSDSVETALKLGRGIVIAALPKEDRLFSSLNACVECGISFEKLEPRMFSFNSPYGACAACHGLGTVEMIDSDLVIPDKNLTLKQNVIRPWLKGGQPLRMYYSMALESLAEKYHFSLDVAWKELPQKITELLLHGTGSEPVKMHSWHSGKKTEYEKPFEGILPNLQRRYEETESVHVKKWLRDYMSVRNCPSCSGSRLKPESLAVTVDGKNIIEATRFNVRDALAYFMNMKFAGYKHEIAKDIIKEIVARLSFMVDVGLPYLTLDRKSASLSGGEAQRIRLATQIGAGLVGVMYILDEPSIGLHQRDNGRLLETLKQLRDMGNTVIVVEHDEATMRSADFIVDLGPGAGIHGGEVIAKGTLDDILSSERSLTGQYLSRRLRIPVPQKRRIAGEKGYILIKGACEFNLKNIYVTIPLGVITCITGVSGSGKSTLVDETINKGLRRLIYHSKTNPGRHEAIVGWEKIENVIVIDQSPIGRTPRSNPATYTGMFTHLRDLFAGMPAARVRGYNSGRFSFNVPGGRCEACHGDGVKRVEMHFLPDVYVQCEVCGGKRYNKETLEVRYKGRNIYDILESTVEETLEIFRNVPKINAKLQTLVDVGLGYLKLGQSATTLSGGEAQRIKLAAELSRPEHGRNFYILDEPTTGLHFDDIVKLLAVINRLADEGNTIVVVEHNLDVIKASDHVIDLGPEGGDEGGYIVAQGTPEEVAEVKESYTGQYLNQVLAEN